MIFDIRAEFIEKLNDHVCFTTEIKGLDTDTASDNSGSDMHAAVMVGYDNVVSDFYNLCLTDEAFCEEQFGYAIRYYKQENPVVAKKLEDLRGRIEAKEEDNGILLEECKNVFELQPYGIKLDIEPKE